MKMMMKMMMKTRAEGEGEGKREREEQREKERDEEAKGKKQNAPNHSRDHDRLPVRAGAFKAVAGSSTHKKRLAQRSDSLVRVSRRVEKRPQKKRVHVENAVTQGYRLNASVYRVCPCQPRSEYHIELDRSFFFWPEGPCFATDGDCSSNASLSISSSSWESGAVDVTPAIG